MTGSRKAHNAFNLSCRKIKMLLFDCDGVMTDGHVVLGNDGLELKFFSAADGIGLKMWNKSGLLAGCITGRASQGLERRAAELKFDELHQKVTRKGDVLAEIIKKHGLTLEEVAYIGDDLNDLSVGTRVGLFFVPANHHPAVRPFADYVLSTRGGHGAVREAIDLMLDRKGLIEGLIEGFINQE
ncbi:MAG: 3-deoxy-D-manno-octulosonate 8-phosphate phosphatase [Candidatus Riflebacteria bacterium HGW-Riflebacteria-2]|jgi:3-deoxy-D-manno-octulosonate 8-phosphate phosphatase (KDO 8-P phosphatase)|nr:MAG: 3-deoxy-D-manno-octulosonate 8-phosphate phosphatase [Candidatus Riflebacteria bacterium HGW-Riflebacteria-2]